MARTVNAAFDNFMTNVVNLDRNLTVTARSSREWLVQQIALLPGKIAEFPALYSEKHLHFGSFQRKTTKRPLNDVDIIIALSAEGSTYEEVYGGTVYMTAFNTSYTLNKYCHDYTQLINSKKIINKIVASLTTIPQYRRADIHRDEEAATLDLNSYEWTFDIVPAFFTKPDASGRTYYIIPDGRGHWKKTDPRIDYERAINTDIKHDHRALQMVRLMKFWNSRTTMPSMGSYLLENLVLDYYQVSTSVASQWVDIEASNLFLHIYTAIYSPVYDPKRIQGDLNNLSLEEQYKISSRAWRDYQTASAAMNFEKNEDHQQAIRKWGEIFGPSFPSYG